MDDFTVAPAGTNDVLLARIEALEANVLALRLELQALRNRVASLEPARWALPAVYGPLRTPNTTPKPVPTVDLVAQMFAKEAEERAKNHRPHTCADCGCWITPGAVSYCVTKDCPHQIHARTLAERLQCPSCGGAYTYASSPSSPFAKYVHCPNQDCGQYGRDAAEQED